VRVNYRGYAVAVHRRLCYPHVTSAAVVYGGWGYWTNGQRRVLCCYMSEIPFILSLQSTCKVSNELFAFKVIRHFAASVPASH